MPDQVLRDLFDSNASSQGLWVKLNRALGYEYPLAVNEFQKQWLNYDLQEALDKIIDLMLWFDSEEAKALLFDAEKNNDGVTEQELLDLRLNLIGELIVHCLNETTLMQVIHTGNKRIEEAVREYLQTRKGESKFINLLIVIMEGEWDPVPTVES